MLTYCQLSYKINYPKMLILTIDQSNYPFGRKDQSSTSEEVVKVQQTVEVNNQNRHELLSKAAFIKNLKSRYLIKVDSVLEEAGCLHILYEHVIYNFSSFSRQLGELGVSEQLRGLSEYLANIGIRVPLCQDRIGFTAQGQLKYFLGLDFEWEDNPDEMYLKNFYAHSREQLIAEEHLIESKQVSSKKGCNFQSFISKKQEEEKQKARKSSFATLPSRFNRWRKLDQKLNSLKASGRDQNREQHFHNKSGEMWRVDNGESKSRTKRTEDRKYSVGQQKFISKLFDKQSDIKSEYQSREESTSKGDNVRDFEVTTKKSKTKLEEMKQREYRQLTSSNKNYLKDFMCVLEDDPFSDGQCQQEPFQQQKTIQIRQHGKSVEDLKERAKKAINNSMKVMQRFREFRLLQK